LENEESIILGSLFMQNFVAYYENDYNTTTQTVSFAVSPIGAFPLTYIGTYITESDVSPFNKIITPTVLDITI